MFDLTVFGSFKVNFVDESEESEFTIEKYDNFVLEYLSYKGENVDYCVKCCSPFLPTNNFQTYCKVCAKDILKEQWKEASYKYRHKGEKLVNTTHTSVSSV